MAPPLSLLWPQDRLSALLLEGGDYLLHKDFDHVCKIFQAAGWFIHTPELLEYEKVEKRGVAFLRGIIILNKDSCDVE